MFTRPLYTEPDAETAVEQPVPISKASKLFPSKPCTGTLWRWMQDGIVGPNGDRLRLKFLMCGKRRFIEPAAAREFCAACNSSSRIPAATRKDGASKALEALGC